VTFVDRWPLFGASENTYQIFTGRIKTGLCGQETTTRRYPSALKFQWEPFSIERTTEHWSLYLFTGQPNSRLDTAQRPQWIIVLHYHIN